MTRRFDNKAAVVTGAAQGIGRACALRLASEGARVMVADCVDQPAQAVVDEIRESGGNAEKFIADLSHHDGAIRLMSFAREKFDRIDVSVHNVGGTIWAMPFQSYLPEQIEAEINRSLWPTLWCCHAVLPIMLEQGFGSIVNIGSTATRGINRAPYSAAKGGVHTLTVTLALELAASGVRINCVAPGGTEVVDRSIPRSTEELSEQDIAGFQAVIEQTIRDTPMGRFGSVDEQASAVAFLASDEASYITGQILFVAGGGIG